MLEKWKMAKPSFEADEYVNSNITGPWSGHRNFAYDLICMTKPGLYVELGTHFGNSFFAVCQAVKDTSLSTQCIAVDTWEGEEHAGKYGEYVYDLVKGVVEKKYSDVNISLLKKTFREALDDVDDAAIDILHIDGLHTYEAVTDDYNTWLPKLKENGVVLLHDVCPNLEYGTRKFWEEMSQQFPNYLFEHSWGLGVLFPKGRKLYDALEAVDFSEKIQHYVNKAELDLKRIEVQDLTSMVEARDEAMASMEKMIIERDVYIKELESRLS